MSWNPEDCSENTQVAAKQPFLHWSRHQDENILVVLCFLGMILVFCYAIRLSVPDCLYYDSFIMKALLMPVLMIMFHS